MSFYSISINNVKTTWEKELGTSMSDATYIGQSSEQDEWNLFLYTSEYDSVKVLHRIQYSKTKLAKTYPYIDELCDRCRIAKAVYRYIWRCAGTHQ